MRMPFRTRLRPRLLMHFPKAVLPLPSLLRYPEAASLHCRSIFFARTPAQFHSHAPFLLRKSSLNVRCSKFWASPSSYRPVDFHAPIRGVQRRIYSQAWDLRAIPQFSNQLKSPDSPNLWRSAAMSTITNITPSARQSTDYSYLTQTEAQAVDEELMGSLGFSIDQLMELAGLSVACAIAEVYPPHKFRHVSVLCGPGNNGGDGLVAARHLYHFGYKPTVWYPKQTEKPLYRGLVTQLESLGVPFLSPEDTPSLVGGSGDVDLVIDALFGFSFKGSPRPPFDAILRQLAAPPGTSPALPPVVSVDIPSGWDVEKGDVEGTGLKPDMLVSLTAPKFCAQSFTGPHHFLGGRFVPPSIASKYSLHLPPFPHSAQCVRMAAPSPSAPPPPTPPPEVDVAGMRVRYVGRELGEKECLGDPIQQFKVWLEEAVAEGVPEPNAMALSTVDANGSPSSRIVLLKGVDALGFVWYTNYGSRKAAELASQPRSRAAMVFLWHQQHRQVRVEGEVGKVSEEESDAYFHSRPRGSQLGAIVSPQSRVIEGRHVLDDLYRELVEKYPEGSTIPRPPTWGGFRLRPDLIEFWQGRDSRLHDRLQFKFDHEMGTWLRERLAP